MIESFLILFVVFGGLLFMRFIVIPMWDRKDDAELKRILSQLDNFKAQDDAVERKFIDAIQRQFIDLRDHLDPNTVIVEPETVEPKQLQNGSEVDQ